MGHFRNHRRLKQTAKMVENTRKMVMEMTQINSSYEKELQEIVFDLLKLNQLENRNSFCTELIPAVANRSRPSKRKIGQRPEKINRDKNTKKSTVSSQVYIPEYAKDLWRKIAKKCHPDKLINSHVSIYELVNLQTVYTQATEKYNLHEWQELIYLGTLIDVYTDKLGISKQINILKNIYNLDSKNILNIQNSASWVWGTNWDTMEIRVAVINAVIKSFNASPLPKDEIIKYLIKFENNS